MCSCPTPQDNLTALSLARRHNIHASIISVLEANRCLHGSGQVLAQGNLSLELPSRPPARDGRAKKGRSEEMSRHLRVDHSEAEDASGHSVALKGSRDMLTSPDAGIKATTVSTPAFIFTAEAATEATSSQNMTASVQDNATARLTTPSTDRGHAALLSDPQSSAVLPRSCDVGEEDKEVGLITSRAVVSVVQ